MCCYVLAHGLVNSHGLRLPKVGTGLQSYDLYFDLFTLKGANIIAVFMGNNNNS